jgi:hypothetical protein
MALSCNAFSGGGSLDQTVATTQQSVTCKQKCETLREIEDPNFLLVVIDALNRLANNYATTQALVANLDTGEIAQAVEYAVCATENVGTPNVEPDIAKGIILAQLNELLCNV